MMAAETTLPVLGVPVPSRHLKGLDSLLSVVQMPGGVPVATLAIGGAKNAGLLAVQILASAPDAEGRRLADALDAYKRELESVVDGMDERVRAASRAPAAE
jgi:5-(carboxyamino)imidazole ribonucleotide mutase